MWDGWKKSIGYMVLVYLEKAFDRVPREVISWLLRRMGELEGEIKVIVEMCVNVEASVGVGNTRFELLDVKVRVRWGPMPSPLLFALVVDGVTEDIREGSCGESAVCR